jgi:hypothetical protein
MKIKPSMKFQKKNEYAVKQISLGIGIGVSKAAEDHMNSGEPGPPLDHTYMHKHTPPAVYQQDQAPN